VPTVSELTVVVNADVSGVEKGLKSVQDTSARSEGMVGKLVNGFGALGLAAQGVGVVMDGVKGIGSVFGLGALNEMEQTRASFNAFTKDAAKTEEIMGLVRAEANKTPFAFAEMAKATASLMPVAKSSGIALMDLVKEAEVLAASNPLEGLEGASFSLREAMTGDFTSIIERFNLSRSSINKWKEEGVPNIEIVRRAMQEMGFDSELIAAKAETLDGRWSTFMDTLQTLQTRMGEPIFNAMKDGLVGLQGVVDANMGMFESWADAVAAGIKGVITVSKELFNVFRGGDLTTLATQLENLFPSNVASGIIQTIANLGLAFTQVMRGDLPSALVSARTALDGIGQVITGSVESWATSFAEWVTPASVGMLSELGAMALDMQKWVLDSALDIIEGLGTWAAAFIDWIGPMIPPFLREMGKYLSDMLGWLGGTALPDIISRLAEWGLAFVEWVAPRIGPLLRELGSLLFDLGAWVIGTALPAIISKLAEWGLAFVEWVKPQIPPLLRELGQLLLDVGAWIINDALPAIVGKLAEWGAAFLDWVAKDVLPSLPATLGTILSAIADWVSQKVNDVAESVKSIGSGMVNGIRDGISDALDGFWNWLQNNFVEKIPDFVRKLLNINSPSGVFMAIGAHMVEGLRVGMERELPSVDKLIRNVIGDLGGEVGDSGGKVRKYIVNAASDRGIDPRAALAIARHEGGEDDYMRVGKFKTGWSFWPFQLHYGGRGYEYFGTEAGMGNDFTRRTGLQPGDWKAWQESIDFALDHAARHGWGAWYGREPAGIGKWEGIPGHAAGGWAGLHGPELAWLGERGPEYVIPNHQLGSGGGRHETMTLNIAIGGQVARQIVVEGYDLAVRRGWTPGGLTG
jgi:hypothetical protein